MPFRAFISMDLEKFPSLVSFQNKIAVSDAKLKLVNLDQLHLTLKFLGDTREELLPHIVNVMKESVHGIEPFKVRLIGTGAFPSKSYMRVIWVGLEDGGTIKQIARKLNQDLEKYGYDKEEREFSPHVTIARVKSPKGKESLGAILSVHEKDVFGEQMINSIRLKKSVLSPKGPTYYTVEEVAL